MKFYGTIGFSNTSETALDVWTDDVVEKPYQGDILKLSTKWQNANGLNDDLNISQRISIVADPYLSHAIGRIKYVTWMGVKWKVTDISVEYPRLVLSLGGVFNE